MGWQLGRPGEKGKHSEPTDGPDQKQPKAGCRLPSFPFPSGTYNLGRVFGNKGANLRLQRGLYNTQLSAAP